jgi:hypothetical protein
MKSLAFLLSVTASLASVSATAIGHEPSSYIPTGASITVPRSLSSSGHHKQKDNWGNAVEKDRKKVTIRASKHDHDDISDDFLWAIKKANDGGLVYLEKGKKYVIGKKLDLTFLKDVYVKIDGELKVSLRDCAVPGENDAADGSSSPTTSTTGKPTTSTTRFRRASPSGSGAESEFVPHNLPQPDTDK